jgi:hypothetical protein
MELAAPALKREVRRLFDGGKRLTGGLGALAKKTLQASLRRAMGHPRLIAIGRGLLKPFPALAANLYRLGTGAEAVAAPARPLPSDGAAIPDMLPASARRIYKRLHNAISEGNASSRAL